MGKDMRSLRSRLQLSVLIPVLNVNPASAFSFTGQVVCITGGDSLRALHNRHAEQVWLNGLDCPEKSQAFSKIAKWATSALVFGRTVTIERHDTDKYKRTVAEVLLEDGTNVNQTFVKDGWRWWYRKYAPDDAILEALETEARGAKRGLWVDPRPMSVRCYSAGSRV